MYTNAWQKNTRMPSTAFSLSSRCLLHAYSIILFYTTPLQYWYEGPRPSTPHHITLRVETQPTIHIRQSTSSQRDPFNSTTRTRHPHHRIWMPISLGSTSSRDLRSIDKCLGLPRYSGTFEQPPIILYSKNRHMNGVWRK